MEKWFSRVLEDLRPSLKIIAVIDIKGCQKSQTWWKTKENEKESRKGKKIKEGWPYKLGLWIRKISLKAKDW